MPRSLLCLLVTAGLWAQQRPIVLKASTVLDGKGKGKTVHNTVIVVEGAKIARIGGAVQCRQARSFMT